MKNRSGFTLIELLVAIGIIAVLSAIFVPIMSKWKARHEFTGALQEVLLTLRQARTVAVEENETVIVSIDAVANVWEAFVDDGGGDAADSKGVAPDGTFDDENPQPDGVPDKAQNKSRDTGERIIYSGTVPGSVDITSLSLLFSFDPRGFPLRADGKLLDTTISMKSDLGGSRGVRLYQSGYSAIQ